MLRLSDFDYDLPEDLIAQTPLTDRAASRLLHLSRESGEVVHRMFRDVPSLLNPGDLLVVNDTRVSAVRILGRKATGGEVEFLLMKEIADGVFEALIKPAKRAKPGTVIPIDELLELEVIPNPEGESDENDPTRYVRVHAKGDRYEVLRRFGTTPLPPYIHERLENDERYQTVYANKNGSAAAPTAGLHFTPEIMTALKARGVQVATVTLHVGIDTFRPVQIDDVTQHQMHGEECEVSPETAAAVANCTGRVIAVGTTTVRTLETFAIAPKTLAHGKRVSKLFIYPGFPFQIIDGMFTNFHLPKTTMLLMISALTTREHILSAYQEAVQERYRFLSFGDSMLIL